MKEKVNDEKEKKSETSKTYTTKDRSWFKVLTTLFKILRIGVFTLISFR